LSTKKQKLGLSGCIIAGLLVLSSHSVYGETAADENSLENRLKEFNATDSKLSSKPVEVGKSKPKKIATKKSKVRSSKAKNKKSKRRKKYKRACYQSSASTLRDRAENFQPWITNYSRRYGVSEALIISVITAESCFAVHAKSPKNARGLMQLIPATAKRFGVKNAYVPSQNIKGGTRYLKFLLGRFSGNLHLTVAAYNAGEGAVDRYSGIPPYRETKEYVKRVMSVYRRLQDSMGNPRLVRNSKNSLEGRLQTVARKSSIKSVKNRVVKYAKSSSGKGYFIRPDYQWKRKPQRARVSRLYSTPSRNNTAARKRSVCRDVSSQKLRRNSRLAKRAGTMKRYYSPQVPKSLSSISKETGVSLNLLLRMNRGASRYMVKPGDKILVWQCASR